MAGPWEKFAQQSDSDTGPWANFQDKQEVTSQDNALMRGIKNATSAAKTAMALTTGDYAEAAKLATERDTYTKLNPGSKEGNELAKAWDSGDGIIGGIKEVAGEVAKDWKEAPSTFDSVRATGKNLLAMGGGIF